MRKVPVIFIGHGSPMNAVESNDFTAMLAGLRELYPSPKTILCISAHWMTEGSWVTHMENPKTIHDFYGFPQALFDVQYPAPGNPKLAEEISERIKVPTVSLDNEMWGLDHGTWSVVRHIFPEANIPVVQLSLNMEAPAEYHYELGKKLRSLREEGVLIIGSGNIVHNLRMLKWGDDATPYPWAIEFDQWSKEKLLTRNYLSLVHNYHATEAGKLSVPTPEHYYPLLYVLGASDESDRISFHFEEIHNSSIAMRTFSLGS